MGPLQQQMSLGSSCSCANDPNFAIICAFLQKFGHDLNIDIPNFKQLQEWLTKTDEVAVPLKDLHIKLMRKNRKTVHEKSWESALSKFCFSYSAQDAWEIERFGYKNASLKVKLRVLKELLESQFERNTKFRAKILTQSAESLRSEPIGRDRLGHAYWITQDNDCNLRIYQEHLDEDIWQVVATNREEFVNLIDRLRGNEVVLPSNDIGTIDEDTSSSNSLAGPDAKINLEETQSKTDGGEQKVPKLSIKISNDKTLIESETNDLPSGGEGQTTDDNEYSNSKYTRDCTENIGENKEYVLEGKSKDAESDDSEKSRKIEPIIISQKKIKDTNNEEKKSKVDPEGKCEKKEIAQKGVQNVGNPEDKRRVEPILITQKQITSTQSEQDTTNKLGKKRLASEDREPICTTQEEINPEKNEKTSLPDTKRYKISTINDEEDKTGEEDREDSGEESDTEDEIEEEDIDSAAAEEDENEEKQIEEFDDDDIPNVVVGEAITDPVLHVEGTGSGNECESVFFNCGDYFIEDEQEIHVSDAIEEDLVLVCGEGYGTECLIGNSKSEDNVSTESALKDNIKVDAINETVKLNPKDEKCQEVKLESTTIDKEDNKTKSNDTDTENLRNDKDNSEKAKELSDSKNSAPKSRLARNVKSKLTANICSAGENPKKEESSADALPTNTDIHLEKTPDPKIAEEKETSNSEIQPSLNRKRRLGKFESQPIQKNLQSESEIDINSENTEDCNNDKDAEVDEPDVGGKRLKMRPKQSNTELRKKVEAKKAAVHDEVNSSSGGEENTQRRRKICSPKKHIEKKLIKTEQIDKSASQISSNNANGSDEHNLPSKSMTNNAKNEPSKEIVSKSDTHLSIAKQKKTLEEIIDKKLKKTHEEIGEDICSKRRTKSPPSTTKKNPVTKPLKKNLLKQIWHEETEKESMADNTADVKNENRTEEKSSVVDNMKDNKSKVFERQRKRHSSEEADCHVVKEEPEAKKEVSHSEFHEKGETDAVKTKVLSIEDAEPAVHVDELKKEEDVSVSSYGRRATRRGNANICQSNKKKIDVKRTESVAEKSKLNSKEMPADKNMESEKVLNKCLSPVGVDRSKSVKKEDGGEVSDEKANTIPDAIKTDIPASSKKVVKGNRKQRDVDATNIIDTTDAETPVRQSRRIAQLKIREEAERRKLEEIALRTMKQELKKKKKAEKEADPTILPPSEPSSESEESEIDTKKKVQKKKCPGKNGSWSSGSEEQEEPDEEEYEEHHRYETDPGSPLFRSDHEFSPESDIEDETQVVPMKRARTVRKENDVDNEPDEEEACQKCHKSDHPEWILLCDKCDKGYHCSCLSPVLFYIPEGDWYCPPCQQEQLIKALEGQLNEFDEMVERKKEEQEELKRQMEKENARRLEEEELTSQNKRKTKKIQHGQDGSSSDINTEHSVESDAATNSNSGESETENKKLPKKKTIDKRRRNDRRQYSYRNTRSHKQKSLSESDSNSHRTSNSESVSKSESSSSFSDSDDEPIYKLRKRRQLNVSYRLNEYDDLINSALKKEMDEVAGAGNLGRGKDISTIIEADKEEKARQKNLETSDMPVEKEEKNDSRNEKESAQKDESESEDELIKDLVQSKSTMKKKSRKLTTLDISSEDDDASDEDFKGSSVDEEDDSFGSCSINSDSSLEIYKRKGKSRKKQRKAARRAFRERRKDRNFIVDNSDDDEEVQKPKSKKKRKVESDYTESEIDDEDLSELSNNIDSADLCDDTTTDESDGAWRPNKRKKSKKTSGPTAGKSSKTKVRHLNKSKKEVYSDDDITDTDEEEIEDDSNGAVGGGKQPRSQPLKTNSNSSKAKAKTSNNKKFSDEDKSFSDSGDSTRRTRGRRYAYIEDFDDDSSDGGIKPGVKRPDTPPEEREKFIKRQEEIKRMLAEKNAEGAKLVATPRLTPIKSECDREKKSPSKSVGDTLSTVPMSVIRQAKVLDIDYLQRRGEPLDDSLNDVDDEFDDADLPDDLPEDMDEDAIARMVEDEEEFAAVATRDLPPSDEIIQPTPASVKAKSKPVENVHTTDKTPELSTVTLQPTIAVASSGLQEPVRKRFPMPTMHPPLLRHQHHDSVHGAPIVVQRHTSPHLSHLLQNALSSPANQSFSSSYPMPPNNQSLITRMTNSTQVPSSPSAVNAPSRMSTPLIVKSTQQINMQSQSKATAPTAESEVKPRGRRKKITPLRDTLQKQQTAAAVAAAASASTSASIANSSIGIIKPPYSFKGSDGVIRVSAPTKAPEQQGSAIPTMQPRSLNTIQTGPIFAGPEGFYGSPSSRIPHGNTQRHRGPPPIPQGHLTTHSALRHSYGPPPPLKGALSAPSTTSSANVRPQVHLPPFIGSVPPTRHSGSHLNVYGPPIYGNPNFVHRGNHRPNLHSTDYPTEPRPYHPPYSFYPPPPPLTTPVRSQVILQQPPTSVIASSVQSATLLSNKDKPMPPRVIEEDTIAKPIVIKQEISSESNTLKSPVKTSPKPIPDSRKQLTTLEEYSASSSRVKSPIQQEELLSTTQDSPCNKQDVADDPQLTAIHETPATDRQASEFSGLVSYFSSQHDDYTT